ncbi:MAG: phosphatidate cytidylyltransferase [Proteobacteria bacterium]|nr:phosphatidate cytidylyltransferase [Pseudomonadota bacterium]
MLKQRIITAVILAPLVLAIIFYANNLIFSLFVGLLTLLIGYEWCQIVKPAKVNSIIISGAIAIGIIFIDYASFIKIDAQNILIAATILWIMCFLWLLKPQQGRDKSMIKYALGVGVLILFGASMLAIHQVPVIGIKLTLVLFLLVWVADIGAFVAGKTFGKHKLAPKVSPGKTIEGFVGGLIFTGIYGYIIAQWLQQDWQYFVVALPLITIISVIGDLFASLLKRHANIKDSGFLLPGHGGFLDRFDSLIAVTPFYFAFVHYFVISQIPI